MLKYELTQKLYTLNSAKTYKEQQKAALDLADFINANRYDFERALDICKSLTDLKKLLS